MAALTADQIYRLTLSAGFPPATAVKMVAIALKESSGDPTAHNTTPPDDSYGLWQINMYGPLAAQRIAAWSLSDPSDLFDPAVNAQAAFSLWAGNDANLARNWYIDRGSDMARYQQFLPIAQAAANLVAGAGAASQTGGGGSTATGATSFSAGRSAVPTPRPASTSAVSGSGGPASPLKPSSSPGLPPASSPSNSSTSRWWWLAHLAGSIGWAALVHFVPWLALPVTLAAPLIHGALPTPAIRSKSEA
jgi:hypothetical protein